MPGLPGAAGARGARLKANGDASRIMLLLTAKAAREIVEAVDANTKAIDANTEALKDLKSEVGGMKEVLKRLEGRVDGKTDA